MYIASMIILIRTFQKHYFMSFAISLSLVLKTININQINLRVNKTKMKHFTNEFSDTYVINLNLTGDLELATTNQLSDWQLIQI